MVIPKALCRDGKIIQESRQSPALGLIQPVVEVFGKIVVEVENGEGILRDHVIDMQDALAIGLVEFLYKGWVQLFVADPGGKYEW